MSVIVGGTAGVAPHAVSSTMRRTSSIRNTGLVIASLTMIFAIAELNPGGDGAIMLARRI
jgi:hypothetical protein